MLMDRMGGGRDREELRMASKLLVGAYRKDETKCGREGGMEQICRGDQGWCFNMLSWSVHQIPHQNVLPNTA